MDPWGIYQFTTQTSGVVSLDLSQSTSAISQGQRELMVYVNQKIGKKFKVLGYMVRGFSNGSPDHGIGAMLTYKY
jgi:hypothetical protein